MANLGLVLHLIRILVAILIFVGCYSCAPQPVNAPSAYGVSSGIQQTRGHISTAQQQNKAVSNSNAQQRTLAQRIHDKDILIDRWRETHPGQ